MKKFLNIGCFICNITNFYYLLIYYIPYYINRYIINDRVQSDLIRFALAKKERLSILCDNFYSKRQVH